MRGTTKYARSGDVSIAYQVWGDGPIDLVLVPGIVSHVEFFHELPGYTEYLERLARFARVIVFDKRGSGLSDRPGEVGTLEDRIDDMRAVMDAVRSESAAILGWSEGGPMSMLYAATYPDRVTHLVVAGSFACYVGDMTDGQVVLPEVFDQAIEWTVNQWGEGGFCRMLAPSVGNEPGGSELMARVERYSCSPQTVRVLLQAMREIDVRPIVPAVKPPTLVLRRADEIMPPWSSRWLADHIPSARYVELAGMDHVLWLSDVDSVVAEIEGFLTGSPVVAEPDDRVLATVLFTDVVGSTEHAARLGDEAWTRLLDRFRAAVRSEIPRFRGREMGTRGDDFLICFDGPARAIRCASAIRSAARSVGVQVRSGLHTGEVEQRGHDVAGLAVHIGARVAALAEPGEVLATTTVRDLVVGSRLQFGDRGEHQLKGVPGSWRLVAVVD